VHDNLASGRGGGQHAVVLRGGLMAI